MKTLIASCPPGGGASGCCVFHRSHARGPGYESFARHGVIRAQQRWSSYRASFMKFVIAAGR
jgi:hypothetical protein